MKGSQNEVHLQYIIHGIIFFQAVTDLITPRSGMACRPSFSPDVPARLTCHVNASRSWSLAELSLPMLLYENPSRAQSICCSCHERNKKSRTYGHGPVRRQNEKNPTCSGMAMGVRVVLKKQYSFLGCLSPLSFIFCPLSLCSCVK